MLEFYFLSNSLLLLFFVLSAPITALQAAHAWIIAYNNLKRRAFEFTSEFFLGLFILLLSSSPIFALVNRHTSIIFVDDYVAIYYILALPAVLCFVYLTIKKSILYLIPLFCILLTLPYLFNTGFYLLLYSIVLCINFLRSLLAVLIELKRKKSDISAFTIKHCVDTLPSGVLFSGIDGHIFLVNTCMLKLMERFFGREQMNANTFWENIIAGKASCDETQLLISSVLLRSHSDTWSFMKSTFVEKGKTYVEIIATDITESDRAYLALEEDSQKLIKQNEEIKELTENMVQLRKEQEYSSLRNQIHDVMGQRLTAIQRLLQSQKSEDYKEIVPLLQNIVENLREEKSKDMSVMLFELKLYFKKVGIAIEVKGNLPKDESIAYLFITTLREATTNAARHASSTKIFAVISETQNVYSFSVTNNGKQPTKNGIEGGGLLGIRKRVELSGGILSIEWLPKFVLHIEIDSKDIVK